MITAVTIHGFKIGVRRSHTYNSYLNVSRASLVRLSKILDSYFVPVVRKIGIIENDSIFYTVQFIRKEGK